MAGMHEIDYRIVGEDLQYVEVELDPNEATVAEAGGMMYMEDGIEMETIFGDGSQKQSGFMAALMGAGKRLLTGESLFMTVFLNRSTQKRRIAFGAPYPGRIVPVHLSEIGGELIARPGDWVLIRPGTLHDYAVAASETRWELLWAHFQPRPDWLPWLDWPEIAPGLMLLQLTDPALAERFLDVHRLFHSDLRRREAFAANALELMLLECDRLNLNPGAANARHDERVLPGGTRADAGPDVPGEARHVSRRIL